MFKILSLGAATLAFSAAGLSLAFAQAPVPSATKLTQAQCATLWTQALAGSSGDLAMDKATPYVTDFKKADKNGDTKLSQTEWTDACNQGWVQSSASTGAGEGEKTSDRTPGDASPSRAPGATGTGAAGTEAGKTPSGTSDRTPSK